MGGEARRLWLVRHGESAGNVARADADERGLLEIEITARDVDVTLSARGEGQAEAVGRWLAEAEHKPSLILSSPHLRALGTAERIAQGLGLARPILVDERLREKELGLLNRLTRLGMEKHFPEQAALRQALGKFYFRPPSGESWCDVILRLRSFVDSLLLLYPDEDVLVATHSAVISCFRCVLENLDEARILAIDAEADVQNCSLTVYTRQARVFSLVDYNSTAALKDMHEPRTNEPSAPQAPR